MNLVLEREARYRRGWMRVPEVFRAQYKRPGGILVSGVALLTITFAGLAYQLPGLAVALGALWSSPASTDTLD